MCDKARELFFHQVNLLFHQFPRDHPRPFQLLLHLLLWVSQNQGAQHKIERCHRLLEQKDLLGFVKEVLSHLPPWEPTLQLLLDTVVSGHLVLTMFQVSISKEMIVRVKENSNLQIQDKGSQPYYIKLLSF